MPRLFIQLENGTGRHRDAIGQVLTSEEAALHEAARTVGSILSEDVEFGRSPVEILVVVERADGSQAGRIQVAAQIERDQPAKSIIG